MGESAELPAAHMLPPPTSAAGGPPRPPEALWKCYTSAGSGGGRQTDWRPEDKEKS